MPSCTPDVVDRAQVGVVQLGRRLRLAEKALAHLRVVAVAEMRDLEGLFALQLGVLHQVDGPHAAAAQLFHDAIAPELGAAARFGRCYSWPRITLAPFVAVRGVRTPAKSRHSKLANSPINVSAKPDAGGGWPCAHQTVRSGCVGRAG